MSALKETAGGRRQVSTSRQLLKNALLRLLAKKPIQQISVTELCREASVNRSTFYRLYSIPIEVLEDVLQEQISNISSLLSYNEDARVENTRLIYEYVYDHRNVFNPIMRNYDYRIITMLEKKYYQMFKKEYNVFESEEKCQFLCTFLTAGGLAICRRWLETDNSMSPEEMSELYHSFITVPRKQREPQPD